MESLQSRRIGNILDRRREKTPLKDGARVHRSSRQRRITMAGKLPRYEQLRDKCVFREVSSVWKNLIDKNALEVIHGSKVAGNPSKARGCGKTIKRREVPRHCTYAQRCVRGEPLTRPGLSASGISRGLPRRTTRFRVNYPAIPGESAPVQTTGLLRAAN